jgi:hypothetical protein
MVLHKDYRAVEGHVFQAGNFDTTEVNADSESQNSDDEPASHFDGNDTRKLDLILKS